MTETVLLVGGGGREHAIARAVEDGAAAVDPRVELYACADNRNPGIVELADGFEELDPNDPDEVLTYAEEIDATMAIIGPEAPLEAGVTDALEEAGVFTFGPRAELARIETDKAFQREFMTEHDIPGCPSFAVFDDPEAACEHIDEVDHDLAVKPTGLTGGKGVKVIGEQISREEAKEYIRSSEYEEFVLEERLVGEEFTIQAFVNGKHLRVTPAVQDHKRAREGDRGPNTGGMGSYSAPELALPFMTEDDYHEAVDILQSTVEALGDYRGVLYGQFMLTADGVKVIEYNARFGDPEAMNTLPIMNTSIVQLMLSAKEGTQWTQLSFAPYATVCLYAVPSGYPEEPEDGTKLDIAEVSFDNAILFYASVDEREDGIYTTTSRAFAIVGIGDSIKEAREAAQEAMEEVAVDGVDVRYDIGTQALIHTRVEHMERIRPNISVRD